MSRYKSYIPSKANNDIISHFCTIINVVKVIEYTLYWCVVILHNLLNEKLKERLQRSLSNTEALTGVPLLPCSPEILTLCSLVSPYIFFCSPLGQNAMFPCSPYKIDNVLHLMIAVFLCSPSMFPI